MILANITKKNMIHSARSGESLNSLIFSNRGNVFISLGVLNRTKLWNSLQQTLIHQFIEIAANDAVFTADDRGLILIGESTIIHYNLTSFKEIKRLAGEKGTNFGGADCSPNNIYFSHTDGTTIITRYVSNFSIVSKNSNSSCSPLSVKFDRRTNYLYSVNYYPFTTLSTINLRGTGIICRWEIQTLTIVANLSIPANLTVPDLDFSDKAVLVSTRAADRRLRYIYALNKNTLDVIEMINTSKVNSSAIQPSNIIQATYDLQHNMIINLRSPSTNILTYYASNYSFISTIFGPLNTTFNKSSFQLYTLDYSNERMLLIVGGEKKLPPLGNTVDVIQMYQFQRNCSMISNSVPSQQSQTQSSCQCLVGYYWNYTTQNCYKLQCQADSTGNRCQCSNPNQYWDQYTNKCQWNCSTILNSFQSNVFGNDSRCPCKQNYVWNQSTCITTLPIIQLQQSKSAQPSSSTFPILAVVLPILILLVIVIIVVVIYCIVKSYKAEQLISQQIASGSQVQRQSNQNESEKQIQK